MSGLVKSRYALALATFVLVLALASASRVVVLAAPRQEHPPATSPQSAASTAEAPAKQEGAKAGEPEPVEHEDSGWFAAIAKSVNFAILIVALTYFLRSPIRGYLQGRSDTIRKDLVDAATLRTSAEQQLTDVRAKLSVLPAELDALRARGQEELAAERVRMKDATAREREKLLERTHRDIDLQFRLARRALLEHTANLSMRLARTRIESTITHDDHARLIDRYSAEVR